MSTDPTQSPDPTPQYEQNLIDEHGEADVAAYRNEILPLLRYGDPRSALKEGDHAPDFALSDASGAVYRLTACIAAGPVVLIFYRGGWCPFCNVQLRTFQLARMQFRALNATVLLISPERFEQGLSLIERQSLQFPVLADAGNQVAHAYGVAVRLDAEQRLRHLEHEIDLEDSHGDAEWTLPMPATFVIDRRQRIRYAAVSADYTQRAEPADVLAVLQRLASRRTA